MSVAVTVLALAAAGCAHRSPQASGPGPTQAAASGTPDDASGWRTYTEHWAARHAQNPNDPDTTIAYARGLRALERRAQATAVLQQTAMRHPQHKALLGAYGRALAENGQHEQALEVFARAHTPDAPDPRILSAMGAVLDKLGRHKEAENHHMTAMRISPGDPIVLSNLGLSYVLTRRLPEAEAVLRRAVVAPGADSRVRQNLALTVGLQGRFQEAEQIARADLSPELAAANVEMLRQLLASTGGQSPARRAGTAGTDRSS